MIKDGFQSVMLIFLSVKVIGTISVITVDWHRILERSQSISPAIQGVPPAEGDVDSSRMHHWVGAVSFSKTIHSLALVMGILATSYYLPVSGSPKVC